ncbi:uroporphyrinogen decarboxylase [Amorphus orientalis]|uniref:Uroporphyrinogen decarboxylase n=1 Tax=Amorphus orientalis TaxID=649198 RepID=A0AAE3VKA3_9HYPH|nr:uroporphyrinogen decarboxylase [Amorphus orientalis]MDQ0313729.1 uroporphyrinogen decarboxylase [Amorphus orientalis]
MDAEDHTKPTLFAKVLRGEASSPPPIWLMRQAGRYLPEYRELRSQSKGFLDFCYSPDLASEATLQPIRRFGFDAAIIFSDILVIPDALGQPVRFEEGVGPRLDPLALDALDDLDPGRLSTHLAPVYEAISRTRRALPGDTSLIGFAGAPWTLATYMIAGRTTPDQAPTRRAAFADPDRFDRLITLLADSVAEHLCAQVDAGCDALQIFDSWAGTLDTLSFPRWSADAIVRIVGHVRGKHPNVPIIVFPRNAGDRLRDFVETVRPDAVGLDWSVSQDMGRAVQKSVCVQGNLDPMRLVAGGEALRRGIDAILETYSDGPFVFNLGHGIVPETPIAHVEEMVAQVRASSR